MIVLFLHLWIERCGLGFLSFNHSFFSVSNAFDSTSHRFFLIIIITANDGVSVSMFILDVTSVIVLFIFPYLLLTRVMGWEYT